MEGAPRTAAASSLPEGSPGCQSPFSFSVLSFQKQPREMLQYRLIYRDHFFREPRYVMDIHPFHLIRANEYLRDTVIRYKRVHRISRVLWSISVVADDEESGKNAPRHYNAEPTA